MRAHDRLLQQHPQTYTEAPEPEAHAERRRAAGRQVRKDAERSGIGVGVYNDAAGAVRIQWILPCGAAALSGRLALHDEILRIDAELVENFAAQSVSAKLEGPSGTFFVFVKYSPLKLVGSWQKKTQQKGMCLRHFGRVAARASSAAVRRAGRIENPKMEFPTYSFKISVHLTTRQTCFSMTGSLPHIWI